MIIQREFKSGSYHVANDQPFLNGDLSWAAKGVLGYLFSKPEDWTPRMYDIVQNGPCEKYKIKSIFEELEEHGYLHRRKVRNDEGRFDWEVKVFDHPRSDPGWAESTPNAAHPGQNGGANKKDTQSERQSINTDGQSAPARGEDADENTDAPVSLKKAVEIGQMIGVSERLCREWWLYYDEKGWPNDVKKVSSALRRWKMNDSKYDSGGGGDGAPSGGKSHTERFGDKDVVHFGQHN